MKEISNVETNLARPAIYNLRIKGIDPKDAHIQKWGWVNLTTLFGCLVDLFRDNDGVPTVTECPSQIFERYGLLCNRQDALPLFTWVCDGYYAINSTKLPPQIDNSYIPAGWANRILQLTSYANRDERTVEVTSSLHVWHQENGPLKVKPFSRVPTYIHGPFFRHQMIAHPFNGKPMVVVVGNESGSTTEEVRRITRID